MNESYIDITPVKNIQCFTFYSYKRPNYNLRLVVRF